MAKREPKKGITPGPFTTKPMSHHSISSESHFVAEFVENAVPLFRVKPAAIVVIESVAGAGLVERDTKAFHVVEF